ncbi:MAG TPA: hypothetical protein PKI16_00270 [Candidatus Dojkabacteria bacterium]|nr:hypothetical protein [Candidatus Dojkabacteria bacterium]
MSRNFLFAKQTYKKAINDAAIKARRLKNLKPTIFPKSDFTS